MADGTQKLGVPKPTVFATVNGNVASNNHHSPVVAPRFKISRGTQATGLFQKNLVISSPPPPVPTKPLALSKQIKSPPPVPPKPGSTLKSLYLKPSSPVKPIIPPKPIIRTCNSGPTASRTTNSSKLQHSNHDEQIHSEEPLNSAIGYQRLFTLTQPIINQHSRKSASLGRLEGSRCSALMVDLAKERDRLQRDSGFISCSLENVGQSATKSVNLHVDNPINSLPVAPPRRRRKSAESYEPIYAVIDFSKKRNRRILNSSEQSGCYSSGIPLRKIPDLDIHCTESKDVDKIGSSPSLLRDDRENSVNHCSSTDQHTGTDVSCFVGKPNSSQMNSDIEVIENSFATIASFLEDLDQTAENTHCPSALAPEQFVTNQPREEFAGKGQTLIARLVFGGTLVQQTDLFQATNVASSEKEHKREFRSALKEIAQHTSRLDLTPDSGRARKIEERELSPTPSSSSSSSSSSFGCKDIGNFSDKHLDPDVGSCGSLGDIDTSDATRQNSIEDELETSETKTGVNTTVDGKERSHSFGLRRTLDSLFTSLGKSGIRKAAEKRKTLDLESSSTDTDNIVHHQRVTATRQAPPVPASKFNRTDRAYRSVQPSEKGRSNSVDVMTNLRQTSSIPFTNNPGSYADQRSRILTTEQSATSSPSPYSPNKAESTSSLMDNNSDGSLPCFSEVSIPEEKDVLVSLEGKEKKAYMTAKEIASSERVFVDCLRLICVDFRTAIKEASSAIGSNTMNSKDNAMPVIPEAELNRVLNYLPQLQNLNEELLSDFESRLRNWSAQPKIADVIVRKGPFLKLYSAYIRDFQSQSALLEDCVQKYPRFGKVLRQFEQTERCKSLSLKHYMLKPVQRLPQYRLLLEVYLRHLSESSPDYHDTLVALKVVTDVAEHANNSMKQEDNFQKLIHLQSRLGNCEIIKPGRFIIKEGELDKVSRKTLQPRYFILLNDCLLYTSYLNSPSANCSLKLHHELPLSRMEVQLPPASTAQENENEFSVISTARSFTLSAASIEARDEWVKALSDAIIEHQSKQSTFPTKSFVAHNEFRLGQQAPVWIPDSRVTMCQLCTTAFSITFRRHHCRACGKVVCRSCSSRKASLEYLKFRSARVCDACFVAINEREGSACGDAMDTSNCSSTIEMDISSSLVNVPPVCFVHAFNDDVSNGRPSSDSLSQSTSQAGLRAQQARRDHGRKERRFIPPRLTEVSANDTESHISSYLLRRVRRSWKRNWFVLKDKVLYIYKASEDVVALDTIPVLGYEVQSYQEVTEENEQNVFQLFHPKQSPIVFQAENAALAKKWIEALSSATVL